MPRGTGRRQTKPRAPESRKGREHLGSFPGAFFPYVTFRQMIVDEAHCLHEGVDGRRDRQTRSRAFFNSLASRTESSVVAGISNGARSDGSANFQKKDASEPASSMRSMARLALLMVERILP